MIRLILFFMAVGICWSALQFRSAYADDPLDAALFGLVFVVYTLAALVMLAGTRDWTVRALGLLGTFCGNAVLWALVVAPRVGIGWELAPPPPPDSPYAAPEWAIDLLRAWFIVAGPLLIYALTRWLVENRREFGRWRGEEGGMVP